jgi:hypothetical protein
VIQETMSGVSFCSSLFRERLERSRRTREYRIVRSAPTIARAIGAGITPWPGARLKM